MNKLTGQNVLVTGASSGFGRAISLACAAEGANLALVARRQAELEVMADEIEACCGRAVVCPADVANEKEVLAAVARARDLLGPIDVLINNAGMNVPQRRIEETELDQWQQVLAVNLTGAFLFTRALLPEMIRRERGTIINVASRAAIHPGLLGGAAYSTSKMGMDALTRITNEEGNPHNVRASLVCPGSGNTPLLDRRPAPPPPAERQKLLQPEDVAELVVLIAALPPRVTVEQVILKPTRGV